MDDGSRRVFCVMQKQRRTNSKSRSDVCLLLPFTPPRGALSFCYFFFGHAKKK